MKINEIKLKTDRKIRWPTMYELEVEPGEAAATCSRTPVTTIIDRKGPRAAVSSRSRLRS